MFDAKTWETMGNTSTKQGTNYHGKKNIGKLKTWKKKHGKNNWFSSGNMEKTMVFHWKLWKEDTARPPPPPDLDGGAFEEPPPPPQAPEFLASWKT